MTGVGRRWSRGRFQSDPESLARNLIGALLIRRLADGMEVGGMIVETEAYLGVEDAAAHSFGGRRTDRIRSMYAEAGTAYVYFTYGMHHCFNVVCGEVDEPVAVLIRAIEPLFGRDRMMSLRMAEPKRKHPIRETGIASGPARLTQALSIDRRLDGEDLATSSEVWVCNTSPQVRPKLRQTTRIGVDYAGAWAKRPLRWVVEGHPHASRP